MVAIGLGCYPMCLPSTSFVTMVTAWGLLLLWSGTVIARLAGPCYMVTIYGLKTAECNGLQLTTVPKDLDRDLLVLKFNDNHLTYLSMDAFQNYVGLQEIYMIRNNLEIIAPEAFRRLNNLQILDLEGNKLTSLSLSLFQYMSSVRILSLKSNPIKYIAQGTLSNLRNIEELNFENCWLERIHPRAFEGLNRLNQINLVNNELKGLNVEMRLYLPPSILVFRLHRNPWVCDCRLRWLRDWINQDDKPVNWDFTTNTPACSAPALLRTINWKELVPEQFACPSRIVVSNSTSMQLELNANVSIECVVFGDPFPDVTWKKGDKYVPSSKITKKESISEEGDKRIRSMLHLYLVQPTDAGDYKCIAENLAGTSEVTYKLWIEGVAPDKTTSGDAEKSLSTAAIIGIGICTGLLIIVCIACLIVFGLRAYDRRRRYAVRDPQNKRPKKPGSRDKKESNSKPRPQSYTVDDELESEVKENCKTPISASTGLLTNQTDHSKSKSQKTSNAKVMPANNIPSIKSNEVDDPQFKMKIFPHEPSTKTKSDTSEQTEVKAPVQEEAPKSMDTPPKQVVNLPPQCNNINNQGRNTCGKVPDLVSGNKHVVANHSRPVPPPQVPNHIDTGCVSSHRRAEENPYAKPSELKPGVCRRSPDQDDDSMLKRQLSDNTPSDPRSADSSDSDSIRRRGDAPWNSPSTSTESSMERKKRPTRPRDPSPCTNPICLKDHHHAPQSKAPLTNGGGRVSSPGSNNPKQHIKPSHSMDSMGDKYEHGDDRVGKTDKEMIYGSHKDPGGHYRTLPSRPKAGGSPGNDLNVPSSRTIRMLPSVDDHSTLPSKHNRPRSQTQTGTLQPPRGGSPSHKRMSSSPVLPTRQVPPTLRSPGAPEPQIHGFMPGAPADIVPAHLRTKTGTPPMKPKGPIEPQTHGSPRIKPAWAHTTASLDDILSPPFGPVVGEKAKSPKSQHKVPKPGESDEYGTAV